MVDIQQANPTLPRELWLKRLRYRSWHRGCKETDLVLGSFCDARIETMEASELTRYEALLDEDDADIWGWLTGKVACPKPEFLPLLDELKHLQLHG